MADPLIVGLIVNPIAGMGGSVGLKGTDGADVLNEAIARGAKPLAAERTARTLNILALCAGGVRLLVPPGAMGADLLLGLKFEHEIVSISLRKTTSGNDTQSAATAMKDAGAQLIVFAGGDGTARDLLLAIGEDVPLVGIPCGVKMYSGVFATSPEAAGHLVRDFAERIRSGASDQATRRVEIMDIDELDYRAGRLSAELFGYALCPHVANRLQGPKVRSSSDEDVSLRGAAFVIIDGMRSDKIYLIGPGHSAKIVSDVLGIESSLLGVDVVRGHELIGLDLDAESIRLLVGGSPVGLILGVIGGQGYVLGRGNQQISSDIIRKAGRDGIIVISGQDKLVQLNREQLFVDTGDAQLDKDLEGYIQVLTGVGTRMMMRLSAGH